MPSGFIYTISELLSLYLMRCFFGILNKESASRTTDFFSVHVVKNGCADKRLTCVVFILIV